MKSKLLLVLFLIGGSVVSEALVKESEKDIISSEIIAKKKSYETSNVSAADIQRMADEKRKERNSKVKAVMGIARDADLPAGLLMDSIQDGVVVPELLAENSKRLGEWKNRRHAPRELQIPWNNIFVFVILLVALALIISIRQSKKRVHQT